MESGDSGQRWELLNALFERLHVQDRHIFGYTPRGVRASRVALLSSTARDYIDGDGPGARVSGKVGISSGTPIPDGSADPRLANGVDTPLPPTFSRDPPREFRRSFVQDSRSRVEILCRLAPLVGGLTWCLSEHVPRSQILFVSRPEVLLRFFEILCHARTLLTLGVRCKGHPRMGSTTPGAGPE